MTVSTDTRSVTYNGNGLTTNFPVSFYFLEDGDLVVTLVDANGTDHVQTLTTDYTVSGAGEETGGSVTMLTAPASGEKLRIERVVDLLQTTRYPENTKFPSASHERALDHLTMADQQLQGQIDRAPKFSETSGVTDVTIERGSDGESLAWDAEGNIVRGATQDEIANAQQYAESAEEDADRAEAQADRSESNADRSQANADQAAAFAGFRDFTDVTSVLGDTSMEYGTGAGEVQPGDVARTRHEGFSYQVADDTATDENIETAGGVKLYARPLPESVYNIMEFGAVADGVTDNYDIIMNAIEKVTSLRDGIREIIPTIVFPMGDFFCSQTIQLKRTVHLKGQTRGANGGMDGTTLHFPSYVGGIIVHQHDTIDDGVQDPPTTSASGTIIEGLTLRGGIYNGPSPNEGLSHGIWLRARASIRDCAIFNFAGTGIRINGSAGGSGGARGNSNCFELYHVVSNANFRHGVWVSGSDANAGIGIAVNANFNGGYGIWDASFLGNSWYGCHLSVNGRRGTSGNLTNAYAVYNGTTWQARPFATESDLVNTEPGTDESIWTDAWGGVSLGNSFPIPWEPGLPEGTWRPGGSYCSTGTAQHVTFCGCYTEGSQGRELLSQGSLWLMGFAVGIGEGPYIYSIGNRHQMAGADFRPSGSPRTSAEQGVFRIALDDATAFQYLSSDGARLNMFNSSNAWSFGDTGSGQKPIRLTKPNTAVTFGRTDPVPWALWSTKLFLSSNDNPDNARHLTISNGPNPGQWARGDVVHYINPSPGGSAGVICTTSGEQGSTAVFKKFGTIEA